MVDHPRPPVTAPLRPSRRRLIQGAGAALAAALPAGKLSASDRQLAWRLWQQEHPGATPASVDDYVPIVLSDAEWATLTAIVDRLFPKTDTTPSGSETGAHIYIDQKLSAFYADQVAIYRDGLAAVEASIAGGFSTASAADQDAALREIEAGTVTDVPAGFFAIVLGHTRQGMFCDPIHGGNREFLGWDMIGYPGIKLVWTADDQAIDAVVKPEHLSVANFGGTAR